MADILVVFGTGEGQTEKVAVRIVEYLSDLDHNVEAFNITQLPTEFDHYEYTDWDEVRKFASEFGAFVENQLDLRSNYQG